MAAAPTVYLRSPTPLELCKSARTFAERRGAAQEVLDELDTIGNQFGDAPVLDPGAKFFMLLMECLLEGTP